MAPVTSRMFCDTEIETLVEIVRRFKEIYDDFETNLISVSEEGVHTSAEQVQELARKFGVQVQHGRHGVTGYVSVKIKGVEFYAIA